MFFKPKKPIQIQTTFVEVLEISTQKGFWNESTFFSVDGT